MDIVNNYISFFGVKSYTKNLMDEYQVCYNTCKKFMPLGAYHNIDMSYIDELLIDYYDLMDMDMNVMSKEYYLYDNKLEDIKHNIVNCYYDEDNSIFSKDYIIYSVLNLLDILYKLDEDINDYYHDEDIFDYDALSFDLLSGYSLNYYDYLNDEVMLLNPSLWDINPIN